MRIPVRVVGGDAQGIDLKALWSWNDRRRRWGFVVIEQVVGRSRDAEDVRCRKGVFLSIVDEAVAESCGGRRLKEGRAQNAVKTRVAWRKTNRVNGPTSVPQEILEGRSEQQCLAQTAGHVKDRQAISPAGE